MVKRVYDSVSRMDTRQILPNLPQAAKLLFIRLRSLGDTVLSTPIYSALKSWRPDLRISVLVEHPYEEILLNNPDLEAVWSIPSGNSGETWKWAVRLRTIQRIRSGKFACCINLHGGTTSCLLTGLGGSRYRVGLRNFRHSFCYNARIQLPFGPKGGTRQHTVEYQMEWLYALGLPHGDIPALRLIPDPALEVPVMRKLEQVGIDLDSPYAVIQPTSMFLARSGPM